MKRLLRAIGLLLGVATPLLAGPTGPPAGRYIQLTNTLQSGATFFVSSGTVAGPLTANTLYISGISNGQCLQSGPQGQVFGTGFQCQGGAGSFIGNQDTLQSGATFYVSSGTVAGQFSLVNGGNAYLTEVASNGAAHPNITSSGDLDLIIGGSTNINILRTETNLSIPGPSQNIGGNLNVNGNALYFKQTTGIPGANYISFIASQAVTTTQFVLPNADGTNGQALITDGSHNLSFGTIAGTSIYAATATASFPFGMAGSTFSFVGPSPSTVTYGLAVGSLTVNGIAGQAGAWQALEGTTPSGVSGYITLTADTTGPALKEIVDAGATYYVDTSSVAATAGHVVGWGPGGLGQLVDIGPYPTATPGGPTGAIQYNGGGSTFGGSNNWQITGGSITVISSMSVTTAGGKTNGADAGYFDVFHSTAFAGQFLFTVGSINNSHQFYVADQKPVNMGLYGSLSGLLEVGQPGTMGPHVIWDGGISTSQKIDLGTTGYMELETASNDILFAPETAVTLDLNKFGATFTSSVTVTGPSGTAYAMTVSTSTNGYFIDISSTAHLNAPSVLGSTVTTAGCGAGASIVGSDIAGTITTGGGSPTACTLTFAHPFVNTPVCLCNTNAATACDPTTTSATSVTFTLGLTETTIKYICIGSD